MDKSYNLESQKKLYSKAYTDVMEDEKRFNFEFSLSEVYDSNVRLKDQFLHGFLIFLHKSEPLYKNSEEEGEEDEIQIIFTKGRYSKPKIKKSVIGVI